MPSATFHFPKGFLWGTATASHQVEGGNTNNNWYKWEQEGHTANQSGNASDWWGGRWKEDFDRAAEAGQNADERNMAADAHAPLAVQPPLALARTARVLKHRRRPRCVDVAEDHVGNELFETGILFHVAPQPVAGVFRPKQFVEIPAHIAAKALKMSQAME